MTWYITEVFALWRFKVGLHANGNNDKRPLDKNSQAYG